MADRPVPLLQLKKILEFVMRASKRVKAQATWNIEDNGKWVDFHGCLTSSIHDGDKALRIQGLFNPREKKYCIRVVLNKSKTPMIKPIEVARVSDTPPTMEEIFDKLIKEILRLINPNDGGDKGAGGRSENAVDNVNFSGRGASVSPMSLIHGLMHSQSFLFQEHFLIQHTFEFFDRMTRSFARTFDMVNLCCSTAFATLKAVPIETWMLIGTGTAAVAGAALVAPLVGELLTTYASEVLTTHVSKLFTTYASELCTTLATQQAATIASEAAAGMFLLSQKLMELQIPEGVWEGLIKSVVGLSQNFLTQ